MSLSEKFLEYLIAPEVPEHDVKAVFNTVKEMLKKALREVADEKGVFDVKDVDIYMQGSFLNNVNVGKNTKLEIVVELKKSTTEDFEEFYFAEVSKKRAVKIAPRYSLLQFKNDLYNKLTANLKEHTIKRSNHALAILKNMSLPLTVEILPAFAFKKTNSDGYKMDCILIYQQVSEKYITAYPHLHTKNLEAKDKETNGNLRKIIRLMKRLREYMAENYGFPAAVAPGYFIDCLAYNVPNNLLMGEDLNEVLLKMLNYLNLKNLNEMQCIHDQFKMFGNEFDQWEIRHARFFINALIFGFHKIKE